DIANELKPHAFYIVDSFGSIDKKDFMRFFLLTDHRLSDDIAIGFHGHNNMQFVFANAINMIESTTSRHIIIDSSVFGMGRGAGNLNSEIILDYLNKYYAKNYNVEPLLEVMDDYIERLYKTNPWGFTPSQYLSARHEVHPNYATFLTNKKRLSIAAINEIMSSIEEERKNSFSKEYIEGLYIDYNSKNSFGDEFDATPLVGKEILLIGAGKSIEEYQEVISKYAKMESVVVVTLNGAKHHERSDYHFFANQKRYDEHYHELDASKVVALSNIETQGVCSRLEYAALLNQGVDHDDNVASLFLGFLKDVDIKRVYLAGIDGYKLSLEDNYFNENIVVSDMEKLKDENSKLSNSIRHFAQFLDIEFITPSLFESSLELKILGVIPARYKSSRFEGKPLCIIKDIPMVKRTYLQAKKSKLLTHLVVATDSNKIKEYCESENIPVVMTSSECLTGTDRLAQVAQELHYDLYVNIQGDEPVIDPYSIDEVVDEYKKYQNEYVAYNLYKLFRDENEVNSDTIIKVITNEKDELMYMSRLGVPFNKSDKAVEHKKQVCVYGFTKKALELFSSRSKTLNEQYEDIEILRFVDMGYKVKMKETTVDSIAVDVPEDIAKVEKFLDEKGLA
ncbi:MAG: 3-deoxy-manno-octulosonate cytidylyltransferase, partial [Campylobacterota bacterium]|nr:3-deoxy-manno-octulosonate cytidylyltransferase [Campylobacterota bacterium]